MKFKELTKKYLASPEFSRLEKNSKSLYELNIKRLNEMGGDLPIKDSEWSQDVARSLSTLAKEWWNRITDYKTNGTAGTTSVKNSLITCFRIVNGWGVTNGLMAPAENPGPWVPRIKHEPAIHKPYKKTEIAAILQAANSDGLTNYLKPYAYFLAFAFYSGCRPEEMYTHESSWFRRDDNELYYEVHNAKGKALGLSRLVKMLDVEKQLLEWFRHQPKARGYEKYTFRTDKGHKFVQSLVSENCREVCRLVGVAPRPFYDTRRGMATAMANAKYHTREIADRLGNTEQIVKKYIQQEKIAKANSFSGI